MYFGEDTYPQYTYIKHKDKKVELEQSEALYMTQLLKFIPTLPSVTQMPGNFCRGFSDEKNKELILEPLHECHAKTQFTELMILWRSLRSIHKKSNPSEDEVENYPNLVRKFLKLLDKEFPWFKPLPNQFHRLNHNFHFMVNDRNSLGRKSLEGLEQGNYTTQLMDAHQTFKGDRKKANRGVFKLLRLKSSRSLRKYRRRPATRIQRCSRCKQIGHNATSKRCVWMAGGGQALHVQDNPVEDAAIQDAEVLDDTFVVQDEIDVSLNVSNLDDLLNSSDDELF